MIITVKLLQEKKINQDFLNYFQSLEKQEWEVVDLFNQCINDDKQSRSNFLFKFADKNNIETLLNIYKQERYNLGYAIKYCSHLFTKELLDDVMKYHKQQGYGLDCAIKYCNDLPFFKEVMSNNGMK